MTPLPAPDPVSRPCSEHLIQFSRFANVRATTIETVTHSASEFCDLLRTTSASSKSQLPLLKLGTFGRNRSSKNSLRHDDNLIKVTGIELEYDNGELSLDDAVALIKNSRTFAIAYTTPSHTPETPRVRVLAPFSSALDPAQRNQMLSRLNGVLKGVATRESFALSQAYYYGHVLSNAHNHRVELIAGDFIDCRVDLEASAMGPSVLPSPSNTVELESFIKQQVNWSLVLEGTGYEGLFKQQPQLAQRLESDIARRGSLAERWNGSTDGLTKISRSERDRSMVQILRAMGYPITDAICCAVAWGCDNPKWGRGTDDLDGESGRPIDWERYWVRCWIKNDDQVPCKIETLSEAGPKKRDLPKARAHLFPSACANPPGKLGDVAAYLGRSSFKDLPPELLVAVSLLVVSHAAQNRFLVGNSRYVTPLQLYIIVVAKTGAGKSDLAKSIGMLLQGSVAHSGILEGISAGPALLKHLHRLAPQMPYGPTMLLMQDELGFMLQQRAKGTGNAKDSIDEMVRLYGKADGVHHGKAYSDAKNVIPPIERPNLQILGLTTESPLIDALNQVDADQGFTNRFLLVHLKNADMPHKRDAAVDKQVPVELSHFLRTVGTARFKLPMADQAKAQLDDLDKPATRELYEALRSDQPGSLGNNAGVPMPPHFLSLDEEAASYLDDLIDVVNERSAAASPLEVAQWSRALQHVRSIAGVLAIGTADITSGRSPSLTKDHCKWAWSFVQWSVGNWLDLMTNVSASDEDRNMRAIKQLLARVADFGPGGKHQDQANYGSGKNNDVLCGKGFMPRSLIGRVTRIKSDEIKKALHALIENEEVEAELVTAGSSRAVSCYRLS